MVMLVMHFSNNILRLIRQLALVEIGDLMIAYNTIHVLQFSNLLDDLI